MMKKILIADDHHVVRIGTAMILKENFKDFTIDFAETYDEIKEKLTSDPFDLIFLDLDLPGSAFKSMIKELKNIAPNLLILIFSSFKENVALQYFEEGANGFLNKLSEEENIIIAVNSIFENGYYFPPNIMLQLAHGRNNKKSTQEILSEREFQIFCLLAKGNGNIEISNILNIELSTVATYKRRVYSKLKITNLIQLFELYKEIH